MRAGKLDRTIYIERRCDAVAPSGDPMPEWSTVAVVRAEIVQSSAVEFIRAYGEAEETATVFRIRYIDRITVADRVRYEGREFNLVEVKEVGRRRGLELRCEAIRK